MPSRLRISHQFVNMAPGDGTDASHKEGIGRKLYPSRRRRLLLLCTYVHVVHASPVQFKLIVNDITCLRLQLRQATGRLFPSASLYIFYAWIPDAVAYLPHVVWYVVAKRCTVDAATENAVFCQKRVDC